MRTFSITDVGMVRQVNQDYVYVTDRPLGILQNLFVVADGMGGHQAGDYASKYTVEVLNRELALSEGEDIERCLVGEGLGVSCEFSAGYFCAHNNR